MKENNTDRQLEYCESHLGAGSGESSLFGKEASKSVLPYAHNLMKHLYTTVDGLKQTRPERPL